MTFTIIELTTDEEEDQTVVESYLNHSCLSSLSFGSEEMMWITDDKEKAELMLFKVETVHGNDRDFQVSEI